MENITFKNLFNILKRFAKKYSYISCYLDPASSSIFFQINKRFLVSYKFKHLKDNRIVLTTGGDYKIIIKRYSDLISIMKILINHDKLTRAIYEINKISPVIFDFPQRVNDHEYFIDQLFENLKLNRKFHHIVKNNREEYSIFILNHYNEIVELKIKLFYKFVMSNEDGSLFFNLQYNHITDMIELI